jgi:hypothetical protein
MAHLSLANTVDAAKTLLNPVRISRKMIINHQMGALKIDALAGGVRGDQHLHIWIVLERLLRLHAFLAAHAAVDNYHSFFAAKQSSDTHLQVAQRVAMLREDDKLLPGRRLNASGGPGVFVVVLLANCSRFKDFP